MNFKTLLILLSLLLLVSCSSEPSLYYLEGESEAEIFLYKKDSLIRLTIPSSEVNEYLTYSSLPLNEALSNLFGAKVVSVANTSNELYKEREGYLNLLKEVSESENIASAISLYSRDLRKSSFDNTMNELSDGYDTKGLLKVASKCHHFYDYALAPMLLQTAPWEEKEEFIKLWSRQIIL